MKNIYSIRQIIVSIMVFCILTWAFFKNELIGKIIIIPFLICSIAVFFENLFLILNKEKLANIFKIIFRLSFFLFWFGFLIVIDYISIKNNDYVLLLFSLIFWFVGFKTVYNLFFKKKLKKIK